VWRDGVVEPRNPTGKNQHSTEVGPGTETKLPDADPGKRVVERWRKRLCINGKIDDEKVKRADRGRVAQEPAGEACAKARQMWRGTVTRNVSRR
jgi:hypothetical protein